MVYVFGTVCLDRILRVPALPDRGGYVEILEESLALGGEAANTALALQTWGTEVVLYPNAMGHGEEAEHLVALLREKGLPDDFVRNGTAPTPLCDIYVTPDGERTMFGHGFREMDDATNLDTLPLKKGEWFTAEPNMSELCREAVRRADAAGMKIYTMDFVRDEDPTPPDSFWQGSTDWVGTRGDLAANLKWVQDWVDRRGCFTILTDGRNGFVAGGPDRLIRHYRGFPCPKPVDATGAGDAFRAGMLHGLDQGWPVADCLRFAAASGSLECAVLGATARVPTKAEIERLIAAHPDIAEQYR